MFDDLMLPWTAVLLVEWMYSIPLAAARAIRHRFLQSRVFKPDPRFPGGSKSWFDNQMLNETDLVCKSIIISAT